MQPPDAGLTGYGKPASLPSHESDHRHSRRPYRRVKARTAEEGRRIREVAADLFRQWLNEVCDSPAESGVPVVTLDLLARFRDAGSLRKAFPHGYRLSGPLIPSQPGAPPVSASAVDRALAEMDQEELAAHACAR